MAGEGQRTGVRANTIDRRSNKAKKRMNSNSCQTATYSSICGKTKKVKLAPATLTIHIVTLRMAIRTTETRPGGAQTKTQTPSKSTSPAAESLKPAERSSPSY